MKMKRFFALLALTALVFGKTATSQESSCPDAYTDEQKALVAHAAFIGHARVSCPNLDASVSPLLARLAHIWGEFPSSEFQCDIWRLEYERFERQAQQAIDASGLKFFCEEVVARYGPNGSVISGVVYFSVD
ncbi:MAG: hypothetical protein QUV10_17020 [Paracoccaceae bacterium]|nr:hypothetical protein [Paracoccaceae bacterium]